VSSKHRIKRDRNAKHDIALAFARITAENLAAEYDDKAITTRQIRLACAEVMGFSDLTNDVQALVIKLVWYGLVKDYCLPVTELDSAKNPS
jgi:hypothetical protein